MRIIQQDQTEENLRTNKASLAKKRWIRPCLMMIAKNKAASVSLIPANYGLSLSKNTKRRSIPFKLI